MAEGDTRIETLEDELKVLKGEVRRTLVDLRALLMREDSPLNENAINRRLTLVPNDGATDPQAVPKAAPEMVKQDTPEPVAAPPGPPPGAPPPAVATVPDAVAAFSPPLLHRQDLRLVRLPARRQEHRQPKIQCGVQATSANRHRRLCPSSILPLNGGNGNSRTNRGSWTIKSARWRSKNAGSPM